MQKMMQDSFAKFGQRLEKMESNMQAMQSKIDKVSGDVNEIKQVLPKIAMQYSK